MGYGQRHQSDQPPTPDIRCEQIPKPHRAVRAYILGLPRASAYATDEVSGALTSSKVRFWRDHRAEGPANEHVHGCTDHVEWQVECESRRRVSTSERVIATFRSELVRASEAYIVEQPQAMERYTPRLIGLRRCSAGASIDVPLDAVVLEEAAPRPSRTLLCPLRSDASSRRRLAGAHGTRWSSARAARARVLQESDMRVQSRRLEALYDDLLAKRPSPD